MKITDFHRLKKLMTMTQSDSDQEALTAIRKANAILLANEVNWDRVFSRLVSVDVEESSDVENFSDRVRTATVDVEKARRALYINQLIADVEEVATGSFLDFVTSLREQFERSGHLTPLQVEALEKSRARQRARR